jgi:hypothetical protein
LSLIHFPHWKLIRFLFLILSPPPCLVFRRQSAGAQQQTTTAAKKKRRVSLFLAATEDDKEEITIRISETARSRWLQQTQSSKELKTGSPRSTALPRRNKGVRLTGNAGRCSSRDYRRQSGGLPSALQSAMAQLKNIKNL